MARRTFNECRLYNEDGSFSRWIPPAEVEQLKAEKKIESAYEMRGNTERFIGYQIIGKHAVEAGRQDQCSLTEHDAEANVGITRGEIGQGPIMSVVARSQERVAAWPYVGDTKAVRVGPRIPGKSDVQVQTQSGRNRRGSRPSSSVARDLQPVFVGD